MDYPIAWLAPAIVVLATACSQGAPPAPASGTRGDIAGAAQSGRPAASERVTVRVGVLSPSVVTVIHLIAKRTGAYEENNLTIDDRPFSSGQSAAGIEALLRGDVDIYIGAGAEVARANSQAMEAGQKPPLVVVGGGTPGVTSLVVAKHLQGTTLNDLIAKRLKVGVTSPSSLHLALFRGYSLERRPVLETPGWQFIRMDSSDMVPALTTGQIDGFLHSEPTASLAVRSGIGYVLMAARRGDLGDHAKLVPMSLVTANREWADRNPEGVRRLMKALSQAGKAYGTMSKAQAAVLIGEWTKQNEDIVAEFADWLDPRADMNDDALQAWWTLIATGMRERGEISDKLTPRDVFNLSYQTAQ